MFFLIKLMVAAMRKWLGSVPGDWTRDKNISEEEKQEEKKTN